MTESYLIGGDRIGHTKAINRISELSGQDDKYEVIIRPYKSTRSDAQNRLWHMWVGMMAKEAGYAPDKMKDILKYKILGIEERIKTQSGDVLTILPKTSKLNVEQFTDLIDHTDVFATDILNMNLPRPVDYRIAMGMDK